MSNIDPEILGWRNLQMECDRKYESAHNAALAKMQNSSIGQSPRNEWEALVRRYADGRTICNCREAYCNERGRCEYGCSSNLIFTKMEIGKRALAEIVAVQETGESARDALDDALHGTLPDGSVPYDEIGPSKESLERMNEMEGLIKLNEEREDCK